MEKLGFDVQFNQSELATLAKAGFSVKQAIRGVVADHAKKHGLTLDLDAIERAYEWQRQGFIYFQAEGIEFRLKFEGEPETATCTNQSNATSEPLSDQELRLAELELAWSKRPGGFIERASLFELFEIIKKNAPHLVEATGDGIDDFLMSKDVLDIMFLANEVLLYKKR